MTLIPTIIEQSARSERAYDLISCLLKERIILLTSPIDDTPGSLQLHRSVPTGCIGSADKLQLCCSFFQRLNSV